MELPVEELSPKNIRLMRDSALVSYRVMLDVPDELIHCVSRLLAARRRDRDSKEHSAPDPFYRQAVFVLAWYQDNVDIPRLGAGFGLPQSTSYRYIAEAAR